MAKVYNYITINYEKDIYAPSIDVMQGDTGRGIIFNITSPIDGLDTEIADLTATLNVVKPTGETQSATGTIESLGNDTAKVTIEPSSDFASAINVSGLAIATLVIANTAQTLTSFTFKIKIKENPSHPKPTARKFDVTKVSRIAGVQQYEHCVQSIEFVGLDYTGDMYIVLDNDSFVKDSETEGYHNTVPLTNNTFVIGQPMTFYSGVFKCQLLGETTTNGETTKFEISPVFYIEVGESLKQGETTSYPIDPNITFGINEYITEVKEQAQSEIEATGQRVIASIPSDYTALEQATYNAYPSATESGNPIYIDDGADDIPVREMVVNLEPRQEGTGDPSPTNVRPISGYDGVEVKQTGKNMCAGFYVGETTSNGITFTYIDDDGGNTNHISIVGTSTAVNADSPRKYLGGARGAQELTLKAGVTYLMRIYGVTGTTPRIRLFLRDENDVTITWADSTTCTWTFTPTEDITFMRIMFRVTNSGSVCNVDGYFQIEVGSTPTEYEEFQTENTYSITFPSSAGTVYGGSLNVTTGELTVDKHYLYVDPAKIPDSYIHFDVLETNARIGNLLLDTHFGISEKVKYNNSVAKTGAISNWMVERNRGYGTDITGFYFLNNKAFYLFLPKDMFATQDTTGFKQYLTDNPLYILFPLETPQTYQLTPTEVSTLLKSNTIWSDGEIDLEYRQDTTTVIEKLTSAIISLGGNI